MRTPTLGLNLLNARQEVDGVPVPISWKETIYQEPVESLKKLLETWEKTNERLYKATEDSFGFNPKYGCKRVNFDKGHVARFIDALDEGFSLAKKYPGKTRGELAVRRISNPNLSNERARPLFYDGYSTYGKVEAHLNPIEQRKNTTILRVGDLPHLVQNLDGFKELYEKAQGLAGGLTLLDMHVLQQSSAQAIFSWHHDCEQYAHMVLSVVLSLTDTNSSMQVAGYDEIAYEGAGSAVAFISNAMHRSGYAERGTKKVAFFFGMPCKMDTYETFPLVLRAPLPSLPIFYDKYTDSSKVGCFCLHNHMILEKQNFAVGMRVHVSKEGGQQRQGKMSAQLSNNRFSVIYDGDEDSGEENVELEAITSTYYSPKYLAQLKRGVKRNTTPGPVLKISKTIQCKVCLRYCHKPCLGLDEDEDQDVIICPICSKKCVKISPTTGKVTVDGSELEHVSSLSMTTYKQYSPVDDFYKLDANALITGLPHTFRNEGGGVRQMNGSRERRIDIPPTVYNGPPLKVTTNLQTTSIATQKRTRDAVWFFTNLHALLDGDFISILRRDPYDYYLPPECLCYQGNGWVHIYVRGVVFSSAKTAKETIGDYQGGAPFREIVPGAIEEDPGTSEGKKLSPDEGGEELERERIIFNLFKNRTPETVAVPRGESLSLKRMWPTETIKIPSKKGRSSKKGHPSKKDTSKGNRSNDHHGGEAKAETKEEEKCERKDKTQKSIVVIVNGNVMDEEPAEEDSKPKEEAQDSFIVMDMESEEDF